MASLSKREQARNERELQDLLTLPGNSQCADCGARNPVWASWNLGIFLCVRCASLHRKLGTHISKVKSLSMDKWTTDQVETMKQRGNTVSNKTYNPKNKTPDIPLDADEVDSAMERFIRKKYQEKSLVDGKPELPSRSEVSPSLVQSPYPSPNPELPPTGKKHKFFGFSLRTSSKKDRPGLENAFKITPVEYSPSSGQAREVPELELQLKLSQLKDMGFPDDERNLNVLKRSGGDLERTIATLVKLGPSDPSTKRNESPAPPSRSAAPTSSTSNNPFDQLDQRDAQSASAFGISLAPAQTPQSQQPTVPNSNPWQAALPLQQNPDLSQQFSTLQVSNPLFPNHTGGYGQQSSHQDPRLQNMTPPVSSVPQPYGYTSSPTSVTSNPFYQKPQPLSSQSTGNNPFLHQQQTQPVFAPSVSANPFLAMQQTPSQTGSSQNNNPFGLAPNQSQQPSPPAQQSFNPFGQASQTSYGAPQLPQGFTTTQPQHSYYQQTQSPQPQIPSFQYGQPQPQPTQQLQTQPQLLSPPQQQAYYQNQQFQPQSQPNTLSPQMTGRYTKTDIMALFSQPSQFQQQPLAPVHEAQDDSNPPQQQINLLAPSNNPYGSVNLTTPSQRSVTMPAFSSMHSSGGAGMGSRNPFMTQAQQSNVTPSAQSPFGQQQTHLTQAYGVPPPGYTQPIRHVSNESVSVNNPNLIDGRHSPDAFASLSSRY